MSKKFLYIGGGFDVLHSDHKEFIERGVNSFLKRFKSLPSLIIGLKTDKKLSNEKGGNRPFFSFEWRKKDMGDFLDSKNYKYKIIKEEKFESLDLSNVIVQTKTDGIPEIEEIEEMKAEYFCVNQVNILRTSDLEVALLENQKKSNCKIRKVGALLIRNGKIVKQGYSGSGNCNLCKKYIAYKNSGGNQSKDIPCDYPHAEEMCLISAIKGDDLIITCSPCTQCSKEIVSRGIRRVVYLEKYYDENPIIYLKNNGVECRKAGIN
jgi:dCMP deaminase